jgi:hypothetical protein
MCLIAYVPAGKALTRAVFDNANSVNNDGIGIMSVKGVQKFFGSKALKRARAYAADLAKEGLPHAVHWRYATHGSRGMALCHPFKLPIETDAYLMHNGVISSTAKDATEDASDTLLFVNKLTDAPTSHEPLEYWNKVCDDIGSGNKACVMYPGGHFIILNKDKGTEIDGIWYSNLYSLPPSMRPQTATSYFVPARLRPVSRWDGYSGHYYETGNSGNGSQGGGYYETNRPAHDWGGPFGSMIYWSKQHDCYGYWENRKFIRLAVGRAAVQDDAPTPTAAPTKEVTATMLPRQTTTAVDNLDRCPRCIRPKDKTPFFLECQCDPAAVADFLARQKPTYPAGPTLGDDDERPLPKQYDTQCTHGESNWENCRDCVNELETGDDMCRLPSDTGGYDPQKRADELATRIVLPLRDTEAGK